MKQCSLGISHSTACLKDISLDDELSKLVQAANPVGITKMASLLYEGNPALLYLLAEQSPLICYQYRNNLYLLSGFFTYTKLAHHAASDEQVSNMEFPIKLYVRKPDAQTRRLFALHSLCNSLLNEGGLHSSEAIGEYLSSWFRKDANARSIYQSSEWQSLYPELTTTEAVSKALHLNKKLLGGQHRHS